MLCRGENVSGKVEKSFRPVEVHPKGEGVVRPASVGTGFLPPTSPCIGGYKLPLVFLKKTQTLKNQKQ